jgi:hypothetical protein
MLCLGIPVVGQPSGIGNLRIVRWATSSASNQQLAEVDPDEHNMKMQHSSSAGSRVSPGAAVIKYSNQASE